MSFSFVRKASPARSALALASFAFPAAVYFAAFWLIGGRRLFPGDVTAEALGLAFREKSPAMLAADLAAREAFLISSTAMLIISVSALGYALAAIHSSRGRGPAVLAALAAALIGTAALANEGNIIRDVMVERPLRDAAVFGAEGLRRGLALFVSLNTFVGLAAVGAMMARFADLAWGPETGVSDRREIGARAAAIREAIYFGSAILTVATVTTYFFYHYPLAVMTEASEAAYRPISGIGALRWGASYTAVLAAASIPAVAALIADRRAAVEAGVIADEEGSTLFDRKAWADRAKAIGVVATVIAPAVATPLLEIIGPLLK